MSSVGEMLEANQKHMMNNMEELVERQVKLWKLTIDAASKSWTTAQKEANERFDNIQASMVDRFETAQLQAQDRFESVQSKWTASQNKWNEMTEATTAKLTAELSSSIAQSVSSEVTALGMAENEAGERVSQHWDRLHSALTENARILAKQQSEMARQGDALLEMVSRTGDLNQLQDSLNHNVNSLVVSGKLDETVAALSGAINLLNARLTPSQLQATGVQPGSPQQMRVYRGPERNAA